MVHPSFGVNTYFYHFAGSGGACFEVFTHCV
jgi:hypothetical protein